MMKTKSRQEKRYGKYRVMFEDNRRGLEISHESLRSTSAVQQEVRLSN